MDYLKRFNENKEEILDEDLFSQIYLMGYEDARYDIEGRDGVMKEENSEELKELAASSYVSFKRENKSNPNQLNIGFNENFSESEELLRREIGDCIYRMANHQDDYELAEEVSDDIMRIRNQSDIELLRREIGDCVYRMANHQDDYELAEEVVGEIMDTIKK